MLYFQNHPKNWETPAGLAAKFRVNPQLISDELLKLSELTIVEQKDIDGRAVYRYNKPFISKANYGGLPEWEELK